MCARTTVRSKATFRASCIILLIFSLLGISERQWPGFHPDLIDGLRGMCIGIVIGGFALTAWRNRREDD